MISTGSVAAGSPLPTISVVVLSYNRAAGLRRTLESLTEQTLRPTEVIVCDDCSTDESLTVAESYVNRLDGLIVYPSGRNVAMPSNVNRGLIRASGSRIFIAHDGDWFSPELLAESSRILSENGSAGFAFSAYRQHLVGGTYHDTVEDFPEFVTGWQLLQRILSRRHYDSPIRGSALIRREVFGTTGNFSSAFGPVADVDFWLRALDEWDAAYVSESFIHLAPLEVQPGNFSDRALDNQRRAAAAFICADIRSSVVNGRSPARPLIKHAAQYLFRESYLKMLMARRRLIDQSQPARMNAPLAKALIQQGALSKMGKMPNG